MTILEVSTKNLVSDRLALKMALSHLETAVGSAGGFQIDEPYTNMGWTFFKLTIKPDFQRRIEEKFGDMIGKYKWKNQDEKFTHFMKDYLDAKNCNVGIKFISL
ncbi:MAG: hypothetical protein R3237_03560 [Nitrosopumilaceae archaeon]|nr:hypothetical protein [Nitrosopumilaceae archaeon]